MRRTAGILTAISSLPSKYGIGSFSESAYRFVDWIRESGQTYWQILPLGPTSYGDSPYQSFSTFAGNPYFISLESLIDEGILTKEECDSISFGRKKMKLIIKKYMIYGFLFCVKPMNEVISAKNGHWEKGPGIDLFYRVEQCLGWHEVIAEDLGYVTESVR